MTFSDNRRDYLEQGQQDDYFDTDLAIAGKQPAPEAIASDAVPESPQDDYFDTDLSIAARDADVDQNA